MAEHHALIGRHHESLGPPAATHLADYRTLSEVTAGQPHNVGKLATYSISDQLASRYPYPEDAKYDFQEPSIAYGRAGVTKTLQVLRDLVAAGSDSDDSAMLKQANIAKLHEALSDHRTIGDTVNSKQQSSVMGLLKELLSDPDAGVRQGAAGVLGRLATLIQGRQALCQSGCAESLAAMLEDMDAAGVRLEAGRTLKILTCSTDGRDEVAEKVSDGAVVVKMVRALLSISGKHSSLATPGLAELLLESLASVLVGDKAIQSALSEEIMPFLVYTLKRRRMNMEAMKALVSVCSHPDGKIAAIENGALSALCGLLASEKAPERQLSARAVLIMCVEEQGKHKAAVCVPNLVYQLYETDHDMYMNALLALRSIAESPTSRATLLKVLEDDPAMLATMTRDMQIHLAAFRYEPNLPPRV
jgi:hypothetical protein